MEQFPAELLAQLSFVPEETPPDFTCAICCGKATNRFRYSPREFERGPICRSCQNIAGYAWNGAARGRTRPTGGSFRDRDNVLRISVLAEALAIEAHHNQREQKHGRA